LIGAALLLGLGLGAGWLGARRTQSASAATPPATLETAPVERRDIGATVLATGVVRPRVGAQVNVGSRASGVVQRLHVTIGDRVRADELLAELDRTAFETQVQRAEAALAAATAERGWAEQEYGRVRPLADSGHATPAELSQAVRAMETARAREREGAAALDAARVQLGYTTIRAPIPGVVASVSTQEGETVAASFAAPTFLTIVDLARLEVWAYVDETDIGRIRVGQRVRFTVDTYPDEAFEGRVTAIRPTAEIRDNVVTYVTIIEFENRPDRLLRPEMTATITITIEGRNGALSVPNGALRRDAEGPHVLVAGRGGLERRAVSVGFRGAEFAEIRSGVQAGERVLVGRAAECGAPRTNGDST
jgi:macrolide-specific efflux system membrane fusion protein